MPDITFTEGNDTYTVSGSGTYGLTFLGGDDLLTVDGGDFTSADLGDGNDHVRALVGQADVNGGLGDDRYDIWSDYFSGNAGDGNDSFYVRGGFDVVVNGDTGRDSFYVLANLSSAFLSGGDGNDVFFGQGHDLVSSAMVGGAGDDRFFDFEGFGGDVPQLQGGPGNDLYRFDAANPPYVIEEAGAGTDTVQIPLGTAYVLPTNVENLRAVAISGSTSGAGTLIGNELNNVMMGAPNQDQIQGLDGNDWLYGKAGADLIDGGAGKNHLYGGDGNDQLLGGDSSDWLDGGSGDDTMQGGLGDDTYFVDSVGDGVLEDSGAGTDMIWSSSSFYSLPTNVENGAVRGSAGVELDGNAADNILTGGIGNDTLGGSAGNDRIRGGAGNDVLNGSDGNDVLTGGAGADTMDAGAPTTGADTFVYSAVSDSTQSAMDHITDFEGNGTDRIDLSALDANTALAGDQAFAFAGVTPTANSVWIVQDSGSHYFIYADVNGDTTADLVISLDIAGGGSVTSGSFLL